MSFETWQWVAVVTTGLPAIAAFGATLLQIRRAQRGARLAIGRAAAQLEQQVDGPSGSPGAVLEFRVTGEGRVLIQDRSGKTRTVSLGPQRTERLAHMLAGEFREAERRQAPPAETT